MKPASFAVVLTVGATVLCHMSCKKEFSREHVEGTNTPPIAMAGNDTTIESLASNTVLDGRHSFDREGVIVSFRWTMIAGAPGTIVSDPDSAITLVRNLSAGMYAFELTVKDKGGLSARDTVNIGVGGTSDTTGTTLLPCNTSLASVSHLPTPGLVNFSIAAGNKLLFARGNGTVDIYDNSTMKWESVNGLFATSPYYHSQENYKVARVGHKIIFSAMVDISDPLKGQVINIYDTFTTKWTISHLSQARSFYALAVAGNKAFYAGGNTDSKKMDVYDAGSDSWSLKDFDSARQGMVAIGFKNKVYFAGGFIIRKDSLVRVCDEYGGNCDSVPSWVSSDRVDILDLNSNTWSVQYLGVPRANITAGILGDKIVFAGGYQPYVENFYSTGRSFPLVEFYNTSNDTWILSWFGPANSNSVEYDVFTHGIHTIGSKLLIPESGYSGKIHIYDENTSSWSVAQMPHERSADMLDRGKIVSANDKLLFIGQYAAPSNNQLLPINIYNSRTGSWCHSELNISISRMGVVQAGYGLYIAGGLTSTSCCGHTAADTVWYVKW